MKMGRLLKEKLLVFWKKETVFCVACVLAIGSMFLIVPDQTYASYLDYRVLALLFCLMAVMEGFKQTGMFRRLAGKLLSLVKNSRQLYLVLVFLCFFTAMWITNDVALLTFVPFTILVLKLADLQREMIPVIVLQTIAANLGSMLTPIGNPQNLYLYSISGMNLGEFLGIMGPLTGTAFVLLLLVCFLRKNEALSPESLKQAMSVEVAPHRVENVVLTGLFVCSLLSVARILPWQILLIITIVTCVGIYVLGKEELLLKRVDYALLLTFVAFFIFIGNMERIRLVREILSQILKGREQLLSFLCSQVISNVPAAILLSGFTTDYAGLLRGVNIGGLGTLIASLASLISYKMYVGEAEKNARIGTKTAYIKYFTVLNVAFAAILLIVVYLIP